MATKDAKVQVRMESGLKADVEKIFKKLGLTTSEAVSLFFNMVKLSKGLPFEVKIPNAETIEALEDSRAGKNLTAFDTVEAAKEASKNW